MTDERILYINERDNVAVALKPLKKGERLVCSDREIELAEDVPVYHKLAVCCIETGEAVLKYGDKIGEASDDIAPGAHVHSHNLKSAGG